MDVLVQLFSHCFFAWKIGVLRFIVSLIKQTQVRFFIWRNTLIHSPVSQSLPTHFHKEMKPNIQIHKICENNYIHQMNLLLQNVLYYTPSIHFMSMIYFIRINVVNDTIDRRWVISQIKGIIYNIKTENYKNC